MLRQNQSLRLRPTFSCLLRRHLLNTEDQKTSILSSRHAHRFLKGYFYNKDFKTRRFHVYYLPCQIPLPGKRPSSSQKVIWGERQKCSEGHQLQLLHLALVKEWKSLPFTSLVSLHQADPQRHPWIPEILYQKHLFAPDALRLPYCVRLLPSISWTWLLQTDLLACLL